MRNTGRLYGIGVGPGDPELITVRGQRLLGEVPVIFVPQKNEDSGSLALSVIAGIIKDAAAKVVRLNFPMVRDREKLAGSWREAAATVWEHLAGGEDGALVNLGDPMLYGTFLHVLEALKEQHPEVEVEVVPGVTSVSAAAARALLPLATGDQRLAVISGHGGEEDIRQALRDFDTVAFLKPNARLLGILEDMGLAANSVYISRATTPGEEIIRDIGKLRGRRLDYFSLLIVRR